MPRVICKLVGWFFITPVTIEPMRRAASALSRLGDSFPKGFPRTLEHYEWYLNRHFAESFRINHYIAMVTSCKFLKPKPARVKLPNFG